MKFFNLSLVMMVCLFAGSVPAQTQDAPATTPSQNVSGDGQPSHRVRKNSNQGQTQTNTDSREARNQAREERRVKRQKTKHLKKH